MCCNIQRLTRSDGGGSAGSIMLQMVMIMTLGGDDDDWDGGDGFGLHIVWW